MVPVAIAIGAAVAVGSIVGVAVGAIHHVRGLPAVNEGARIDICVAALRFYWMIGWVIGVDIIFYISCRGTIVAGLAQVFLS